MSCITKRRGRYVIDCYDQHGKRYRKTMKAGTTKDEARKALRDTEDRISRRTFMHEKKTPTFKEVAKEWHEYKKPNIRATTWEMYEIHIRKHFTDFETVRVSMISTATVEKWIAARQAKGMCLGMLRKLLVTFNQVMAYSVRHRYIDSNPVRDAERPRKTLDNPGGNKNILKPDQIRKLLDSASSNKYRTLFMTAVMTGARQGELLGLMWSDIDLDRKQIHITRTFNSGRFFTPKTKGSIRAIDISPMLVLELRKWKLASAPNELDLVFTNESGGPISHDHVYNWQFKPALKKAELPDIRFHDLRHTYASLLIEQGENIKYIQDQMGHSTPTVTLNVYSHLIKSENPEAAMRLEKAIFHNRSQYGHKFKKGVSSKSANPLILWRAL